MSSSSSGAPKNPPCGMASKMCSWASTPPARSFRCIRTVLDKRQVSGSGLQEGRREGGSQVAEQGGQVRVSEIMVTGIQSDGGGQALGQYVVDTEIRLE